MIKLEPGMYKEKRKQIRAYYCKHNLPKWSFCSQSNTL